MILHLAWRSVQEKGVKTVEGKDKKLEMALVAHLDAALDAKRDDD
jgi:hypothetical protein